MTRRVLATLVLLIAPLAACASPDNAEPTPTTTTMNSTAAAPTTTAPSTSELTPTVDATTTVAPAIEPEPIVETTPEPYIVPCQAQHDEISRAEVEANTPTCDGTVYRYPSGTTVPDDRCVTTVRAPSPWVQGQIDWKN